MNSLYYMVPACIFAASSVCVFAILAKCDPYMLRIRSRLNELKIRAKLHANDEDNDLPPGNNSRAGGLLERLMPFGTGEHLQMQMRFTKAGIYDSTAHSQLIAARCLLTLFPPVIATTASFLGVLPMESAILIGCVAGGFGFLLPGLWLNRAIRNRRIHLRKSLPDFLDLMIVCLDGGLSLQDAIRRVGEELQLAHPVLAFELGIVQRDINLGSSLEQSLKRFAERSDYDGIRTLSIFIREAQRFGSNISEALRNHSDMLRLQYEQSAEEHAQKASVKILLPTLLLMFPAMFVVLAGPAIIQIQEAFSRQQL